MFVQRLQPTWVSAVAVGAAAWLAAASAGHAAPILSVDFDSRASTSATKTPEGWVNWQLTAAGSSATRTYDAGNEVSVAVTVFDADGATGGAGAMDDRDRDPATGPQSATFTPELYATSCSWETARDEPAGSTS